MNLPFDINAIEQECVLLFVRSGGPGGQNVNKVASKAVLRWSLAADAHLPPEVAERFRRLFGSRITAAGDVVISSQRSRDAPRNAADCKEKLRQMLLAAAKTPKKRKPTRPTRASMRRRLEAKRRRGEKKQQRRGPAAE